MANLGYVSTLNINGNELTIKDTALTDIVNEIIEAIGANNENIAERINDLNNRAFDALIKISSINDAEIASIRDGLYKIQYVTVTGEGDEATETVNNSAILIQKGTNQYLYKDGLLWSRSKSDNSWDRWKALEGGVTFVNGMTGAVTVKENVQADWDATSGDAAILNKPNIKVDSVDSSGVNISNDQIIVRDGRIWISDSKNSITLNQGGDAGIYIEANDGSDGTITLSASSDISINTTGTNKAYYNNKEIAVKDDIKVASVNGMTGAVTVDVPVTSVNGMTGAVTLSIPDDSNLVHKTGNEDISGNKNLLRDSHINISGVGAGIQYNSTYANESFDWISNARTNGEYTLQQALDERNNLVTSVNGMTGAVTLDVPSEIITGQIVGRMHRDNVSGTGNLTITGASGEGFNPNGITTAGKYIVVVYSWSDTKTFGYNISFGSNSYTLSTTDGTISDKRELTVSAGALWSGTVTTAVSAGTTIIVEIYKAEKITPALSVGMVALTNLYNDLDGKPAISSSTSSTSTTDIASSKAVKLAYDHGGVQSVNGMTGAVTITTPEMELSAGYTASQLSNENLYLAPGDTYEEAFGKLEKLVNDNEIVNSAALVDLENTKVESVSINGGTAILPDTDKNVNLTISYPVTSVNGQTGAVTVNVPVTSVNGQTGAVTVDLSGKADKSDAIGSLSLAMDNEYKLTLSGSKVSGVTFTVSDVIDLPLETMVVGATYNNTNQEIVLSLKNGATTSFPVSDLVNGLQSEITTTSKLSADLITDGTTNKTVTQTEKNTWNNMVSSVNGMTGAVTITQVNSDWSTSSGPAMILNKPHIESSNNNTYIGTGDDLVAILGQSISMSASDYLYAPTNTYIGGARLVDVISTNVPVKSVNGMTGAVTINVPVTSVNGQTGAVTVNVPVTSVNGQTGAVSLTIPNEVSESTVSNWGFTKNQGQVISFNGQTGAITYSAPVTSVNGQTGTVSLSLGDTNIIETIKVNNAALTPDANKAVNIDLSEYDKAPLIIEINSTDTTVPSGTYTNIGNALANGQEVYIKLNGDNYSVYYLKLCMDLSRGRVCSYDFCSDNIRVSIWDDNTLSMGFDIYAENGHWHGDIDNLGTLNDSTPISIDNGDRIVITDASNNDEIQKTSITFDGSTTTTALTPKGTWETFLKIAPVQSVNGQTGTVTVNVPVTSVNGQTGAVSQVKANWNETDSTSYAYIQNKPTIPTEVTESTVSGWGFTKNQGQVISFNGQTGAIVFTQTQANWNETDNSSAAYIQNKPTIPAEVTESTVSGWGFTKNQGQVISFNGQTGAVTYTAPVTSVNGETGAVTVKANVQSDWNATTGDAVILNKPTIPAAVTESTVAGWGFTKNTGTLTTETQLSKGTATGTGNAVTDINVSNHQITLVKGATYATQEDINESISNLVNSAPATLDTLNELATALGNDPNFATTVATQIGEKYTKPNTGIPASDLAAGVIPDVPVQSVNGQTGAVTINVGVTSFNGQTGAVTYTAPVTSVNGQTGAVTVKANVQSDWNATTGDAVILNKPTIPTVNDSTVTLTMNGNTVGTFTLNKSGNTTIDLGTVLTSHQSIKTVNNESLTGTGNISINGLPTVTSADNGKVLMVVNGAWQLVSPVSLYSGSSTPSNSQGNNGDIYVQS